MAFRMRLNGQDDYVTGTFIHADGRSRNLVPEDISLRPSNSTQVGEKAFPLDWELLIPSENVEIQIKAVKEDQYNPAVFSYYEGAVEISGSHTGRGFLELTGY
jgi:predicted secreted hydrolase